MCRIPTQGVNRGIIMKNTMDRVLISLCIPAQLLNQLKRTAKEEGITLNALIVMVLDEKSVLQA